MNVCVCVCVKLCQSAIEQKKKKVYSCVCVLIARTGRGRGKTIELNKTSQKMFISKFGGRNKMVMGKVNIIMKARQAVP